MSHPVATPYGCVSASPLIKQLPGRKREQLILLLFLLKKSLLQSPETRRWVVGQAQMPGCLRLLLAVLAGYPYGAGKPADAQRSPQAARRSGLQSPSRHISVFRINPIQQDCRVCPKCAKICYA